MIKAKRFSHVTFETPDLERQIAYFTEIAGLALAERENGRAHLATKHGDLVVQLESRRRTRAVPDWHSRLPRRPISMTSASGSRGGRCALSVSRNDPAPGIAQMLSFEDPKGHRLRAISPPKRRFAKPQAVAGIGPIKLGHLAFVVPEPKPYADFYSRVLGFRVSDWIRGLVRFHALRSRSSHHQLRARQAHADAPRRFRAERLAAGAVGLRSPWQQKNSDYLGARPARPRSQYLYLSSQPR